MLFCRMSAVCRCHTERKKVPRILRGTFQRECYENIRIYALMFFCFSFT